MSYRTSSASVLLKSFLTFTHHTVSAPHLLGAVLPSLAVLGRIQNLDTLATTLSDISDQDLDNIGRNVFRYSVQATLYSHAASAPASHKAFSELVSRPDRQSPSASRISVSTSVNRAEQCTVYRSNCTACRRAPPSPAPSLPLGSALFTRDINQVTSAVCGIPHQQYRRNRGTNSSSLREKARIDFIIRCYGLPRLHADMQLREMSYS